MLDALKKLFTKTIQLTSDFFQKSEIIEGSVQTTKETFVSAQVIDEPKPKIKRLKAKQNSA
jgi:hypothetical protein